MKRRTRRTLISINTLTRKGWAGWVEIKPLPPARLVLTKSNSVRKRKRRYRRNKRKSP